LRWPCPEQATQLPQLKKNTAQNEQEFNTMINLGDWPDGTDMSPSDNPNSPFYVDKDRDREELERLAEVSKHNELIRLAKALIEGEANTVEMFLESISEADERRIKMMMTSLGQWILALEAENYGNANEYMQYTARNLKVMFLDYWWDNEEMQSAYEADAIRWYDRGVED
jgi:hypothetical protein